MAKGSWLPNREDELLVWFNNFNAKLPGYAVTLDDDDDRLPPCGTCGSGQQVKYEKIG